MSHGTSAMLKTLATDARAVIGACGLALPGLLATACGTQGPQPDLPTVARVDLARYQGTWHEIARLPMWFQRGCVRSTAEYGLDADGSVRVLNRCTTADGGEKRAEGRAYVTDPATNARLEVEFDSWLSRLLPGVARGAYWVIYLEPDYSVAVVGHPSRDFLWILAREPVLPDDRYRVLVDLAARLGFPTEALVRAPPP
jgi:apolipoprotein D and lipocalin family protein